MMKPRLKISNLAVDRYEIYKDSFTVKNALINRGRLIERKRIFSNINLEADDGESIGIIGKNGVGKSTLLTAIAGLLPCAIGKIECVGRVIPLLGLGRVFQADLTIKENIDLWHLSFATPKNDRKTAQELIEMSGIQASPKTTLRTLSSGMNSRLAFAAAISEKADVYLLDEVFAVGDREFSKVSTQLMKEKLSSNGLAIIVSHNFQLLVDNCTTIYELTPNGLEKITT